MTATQRADLAREQATDRGWGSVRAERLSALRQIQLGVVLDVGCSSGDYVRLLRSGGVPAVGFDLLVDPLWRSDNGDSPPFGSADAERIPVVDGGVDTVIAFETLEHVPDHLAALAEIRRVARRRLVMSVPNAASPPWAAAAGLNHHHHVDRTHVNFFDLATLTDSIEGSGFSIEVAKPIHPIHPFIPALDALGLPLRWTAALGTRLTVLARRRYHGSILVVASIV